MEKSTRCIFLLAPLLLSILSAAGQSRKKSSVAVQSPKARATSVTPALVVLKDTLCFSWTMIEKSIIAERSFVCDRYGNIFCIRKEDKIEKQQVFKLVKDSFVAFNPDNSGASSIWIDADHEVVVQTLPFKRMKLYKLSGNSWYEITRQDSLDKLKKDDYSSASWKEKRSLTRPPGATGKYFFPGYPTNLNLAISDDSLNDAKANVWLMRNGTWEKYFSFFKGKDDKTWKFSNGDLVSDVIVRGKIVYFLDGKEGIWKNDGNIKIISIGEKIMYLDKPVPVICETAERDDADKLIQRDIGIYEREGKLGLRRKDGVLLTCPVFDRITFEKSPSGKIEEYANLFLYHLSGPGMDLYYTPYCAPDTNYLCGYTVSRVKCAKCKGTGEVEETNSVDIKRKVDPTYTTTTSSDSHTNYDVKTGVGTKTTVTRSSIRMISQGYDQVIGHKEIKKTVACSLCKGKSITITRMDAVYDKQAKRYTTKINVTRK